MKSGNVTVGHPVDVATGVVTTSYNDCSIAGKVPLDWERNYSTAALDRRTSLGIGWHNRFFCSLASDEEGFHFLDSTGSEILLPDPVDTLVQGGVRQNFGAFTELLWSSDHCVVRQWDPDSGEVWSYIFPASRGPDGLRIGALSEIQAPTGQGLVLNYDPASGRLVRIQQKLERRALVPIYSATGWIEGIDLIATDKSRHALYRYEHDAQGRLTKAIDPTGGSDEFRYDTAHRLTEERTKDGACVTFDYDGRGRCTRTSGRDGYDEKALRFIDSAGWTEVTDSLGNVRRFQRNADGQILGEINPLNAEYLTDYDEQGRVVAKTDPLGAVTRYRYDEYGNRIGTIDALGQVTRVTYNDAHLPTSFTDAAGNTWQRSYDSSNRLIGIADPEGNRYQIEYDDQGNLTSVTDPLGNSLRQSFNGRGELHAATDWKGQVTSYKTDVFGRLVERTDPLGASTCFGYDVRDLLTEIAYPDGTSSLYTYDAGENLTSITDRDGHITRFEYAPCRRLIKRIGPTGDTLYFGWGSEPARLEAVTNAKGEVYHFSYNAVGWVIGETGFDGRELQFEYDLAGNRIGSINGLGERIAYDRDPLGRLIGQILPDGSESRFAYDEAGYLQSAANPESEIVFYRDRLGRIVREMQNGHQIDRTYDADGNLKDLTSSLGHRIGYEFDPNGFLVALQLQDNRDRILIGRDARGSETKRALPGGTELHQRFDVVGRLVEQTVFNTSLQSGGRLDAAASLVQRSYRYDKGQLAGIQDGFWGATQYSYDPAERLVSALREHGATERFQYDANDNITEMDRNGTTESLEYAQGNRLVRKGDTTYEYDAQGRLTGKIELGPNGSLSTWTYTWDALDQLRSVTNPEGDTWRYSYDPFGRRIEKRAPDGTRLGFVWDEDVVLHELKDDAMQASWVFDPHSFAPLCKCEGGQSYSVITDHLGTPQEMVDRWGRVVWRVDHQVWGRVTEERFDKGDCPLRFQGQWWDEESGLHYSRFRFYDCDGARFISPDPIGVQEGFNVYCYARNPISWVDPIGLCDNPDAPKGPLDWGGRDPQGLSRKDHVRRHGVDDPNRNSPHGVFNENPINQTAAAWQRAKELGIEGQVQGNRRVYDIPAQNAGTQGGNPQLAGHGQQLDTIRIVTERDSNRVITAFPV